MSEREGEEGRPLAQQTQTSDTSSSEDLMSAVEGEAPADTGGAGGAAGEVARAEADPNIAAAVAGDGASEVRPPLT